MRSRFEIYVAVAERKFNNRKEIRHWRRDLKVFLDPFITESFTACLTRDENNIFLKSRNTRKTLKWV